MTVRRYKQRLRQFFTPPRQLAATVALIVFLGLLPLVWQIDHWMERWLYEGSHTNVSAQIASYGASLTQTLNQRLILVKGLSAFVVANAPSSPAEESLFVEKFAVFADALYQSTNGIRDIALAPDGVMTYVYPYEENKSVIGYKPAKDPRPHVRAEVQRAIKTRDVVLSMPYELIQDGKGIIARQAVFIHGSYWGLANVALDLPPMLADAGLTPPPSGLRFALKDQSGHVFFGEADVFRREPVLYTIELTEGNWTLAGIPSEGWEPLYISALRVGRGMEITILLLLTVLAYLITNSQARLNARVKKKTQELSTTLQALQDSEERYRRLIESMNEGILMVDTENVIQMANPKFCAILGYSEKELIGQTADKFLQADDREEEATAPKPTPSSEGNTNSYKLRTRHRSGRQVWLMVNNSPIHDADKNLAGWVGIYQDITQQKQTETERDRLLQQQIAINQLVLTLGEQHDLAAIYHVLYDHISEILPASTFILSTYDSSRQLLRPEFISVRGTIRDVSEFPPRHLESPEHRGESQVIRSGEPLYLPTYRPTLSTTAPENTIFAANAESIQSAIIVPLKVEKRIIGTIQIRNNRQNAFTQQDINTLVAMASVAAIAIQNVTLFGKVQRELQERKRTEQALQKLNTELEARVAERTAELQKRILDVEKLNQGIANLLSDLQAAQHKMEQNAKRLEQANAELESFAYSISHDLRAPLRHISGFSELLLHNYGTKIDETGQHYLQVLQESAQRMDQLITGLLAFSRLGRKALHISPIATSTLLQNVWEQLRSEWQAREIDLVLRELPNCKADPILLEQVFMNLLSNALKYSRGREQARIEVGYCVIEGKGTYYVKDNGIGFDMHYADKLFGVFQRLHGAKEFEGTGVGLAIVQRIINKHGGRIWAEAAPDQGATFFFTLDN